jgi:hypothetical protein
MIALLGDGDELAQEIGAGMPAALRDQALEVLAERPPGLAPARDEIVGGETDASRASSPSRPNRGSRRTATQSS